MTTYILDAARLAEKPARPRLDILGKPTGPNHIVVSVTATFNAAVPPELAGQAVVIEIENEDANEPEELEAIPDDPAGPDGGESGDSLFQTAEPGDG